MSLSKLETIAANLSETVEKIEAAKRAAAEQMKQEVAPLFAALFEAVPTLKSVTWTQYTPYFADGDECIFSANEPEFANDCNPDFDVYRDEDVSSEWSDTDKKAVEVFSKAFYALGDGLKDMFGDHVVVRYTDEGKFETQEYEHD